MQLPRNETLYSTATGISLNLPLFHNPFTADLTLVASNLSDFHHFTTLMIASVGMGPFGRINSRAPPTVMPRPTNPGFVRKTGDANPEDGVENSITVKVLLAGMPRRCAIWVAFIPAISSAAVTNTSEAPGRPSAVNGPSPGITLASRPGIGFDIPLVALLAAPT
jgi:hypothetical protein